MNIRVQLGVIFCWCAGWLSAGAQQFFIQEYPAEVYKGSAQNWKITQDKEGILYVANTDGVLVYDGVEWRLVELDNYAVPLCVATDTVSSKVYVGTLGDIGYLERDNKGDFRYRSIGVLLSQDDRSAIGEISEIKCIGQTTFFSDGGHIYIYENGAVRVWSGRNNGVVLLDDSAYTFESGNALIYRHGNFERVQFLFPVNDIRHLEDYVDNISCIIIDRAYRVWKVDKKSGSKELFSAALDRYLKGDSIMKFKVLSGGRLAFLTSREMLIADKGGSIVLTLSGDMLRGNLWSNILYEDHQHNLWFSTDESIGMVVASSPLSYFDKASGIHGIVYSQVFHNGRYYVGTERGVFCRVGKEKFRYIPGTKGTVWNFYSANNTLYVAHERGILEMKNDVSKQIISNYHVETLCWPGNNTDYFIMGTYTSGPWLVKKGEHGWKQRKIKGFEEESRFMQVDTAGNIWIAHYGKGVWKLRLNETMDSVIQLRNYNAGSGLPTDADNRIFKMNNGNIVAATANGIYVYNARHDAFEPDPRFASLLSGVLIYTIAEAPNGDVYFRGISKQSKREMAGMLSKAKSGMYTLYTTPFHKILWTDTEPSLLATNEGAWIANHGRVVVYNKLQQTHYEEPSRPYIRKVVATDSLLYTPGQNAEGAVLPYEMNSIFFDYNVAYFEDNERVEYQYKLEGFDKDWSHWTTQRQASFTNLPEGDYTFIVRARNIYNSKSRQATYSFHIDPPVYRTVWAYLLYIVSFAGLVYGFSVLNIKRIQWKNELLEREVHEKTKELLAMNEEIMAQNEEISMFNKEVNRKNVEIENQARILKQSNTTKDKLFSIISHDLRGPVHQLHEIFSLMDKGCISEDEFQNVLVPKLRERVSYVVALTDNLLHWAKDQLEGIQVKPTSFNLKEVVQENIDLLTAQALKKKVNLVSTVAVVCDVHADKDMIRLVLRNLVSNAIKFTPADGNVTVAAAVDDQYALVSVHDTGVGLSAKETTRILSRDYFTRYGTEGEKGSGLGLMLCREFIEKNKGVLMIESIPGQGSRFSFTVPLTSSVEVQV